MTRQAPKTHIVRFDWRSVWDWIRYGERMLRKHIFPKGLLFRFILIIILPLILLQALVLLFFYDRHWDTISRRLASDIAGEIGAVADMIQSADIVSPTEQTAFLQAMSHSLGMTFAFEPGAHIPDHISPTQDKTVRALVRALNEMTYPVLIHESDGSQKIVRLQLDSGVLTAEIQRKRFFSSTVDVFLIWMIGFSILLFWIAFLFMKNQVRSIVRLSQAAESFGRGQIREDFKPEGATEVKQAGLSFLSMKNRIQKYVTERTTMLSGVSHDLRTPLTRMKLQLSMMPDTETTRDLTADVTEMENMLEAYLSFARGEGKEQPDRINLNRLVEDLIDKLRKSGQIIDFHAEQDITLTCRPNNVSRALMNLLTNAGRYADRANVTLGLYRGMARIIVDDDGPGIPADKRTIVFRAFTRLETSRNTHTGGIGLGLTIARDVALAHGGDIYLEDSPMGGLRAIMLIPIGT